MYVCVCLGVTETQVHAEIANGARTEEEIAERCGAGTGCGMCVGKIGTLLRDAGCERERIAVEVVT